LHNKPQVCGASVASAAGPFTTKKKFKLRGESGKANIILFCLTNDAGNTDNNGRYRLQHCKPFLIYKRIVFSVPTTIAPYNDAVTSAQFI
jgi:hypothetical protein